MPFEGFPQEQNEFAGMTKAQLEENIALQKTRISSGIVMGEEKTEIEELIKRMQERVDEMGEEELQQAAD